MGEKNFTPNAFFSLLLASPGDKKSPCLIVCSQHAHPGAAGGVHYSPWAAVPSDVPRKGPPQAMPHFPISGEAEAVGVSHISLKEIR